MAATILIVDDNEINLKLLSKVLQMGGYQVVTARSAKVAIRQVQDSRPDLASWT